MKEENKVELVQAVLIFILIVLCAGDPDIIDAIIQFIMGASK